MSHQAIVLSFRDPSTGLISIQQDMSQLDDDELTELRQEAWIDMSLLEAEAPAVDKGSGLVYDVDDATDFGSVATNYQNEKSSVGPAARGLASLRLNTPQGGQNNPPDPTATEGGADAADNAGGTADDGADDTEGQGPTDPPVPRAGAGASSSAGGSSLPDGEPGGRASPAAAGREGGTG